MIDDIVRKEEVYKTQMADIRQTVHRFAESNGWCAKSIGRRAHASIHGKINGLSGVMNIEMEQTNWDEMPELLQPDTPFFLWSSAFLDRDGNRFTADTELYWRTPFSALAETVDRFLPKAWEMLRGLSDANLLKDWPGPSQNPDVPPNFGLPRKRRKD